VQLAGQLQQVTTQSASQNATGNALETEREKHRQEIEQLKEKHQQEIAEAREEAAKRAKREGRNDTIRQIYSHLKDLNESDRQSIKRAGGISQRLLGDAVELSQQQIGNIIRETNRAD
jgi:flagellar biosynthesis/type III secretory pathway protein FliH